MRQSYAVVSGTVFGLVALLQLFRALNQWPVQIASFQVPVLASWVAFLVASALCLWAFRAHER